MALPFRTKPAVFNAETSARLKFDMGLSGFRPGKPPVPYEVGSAMLPKDRH